MLFLLTDFRKHLRIQNLQKFRLSDCSSNNDDDNDDDDYTEEAGAAWWWWWWWGGGGVVVGVNCTKHLPESYPLLEFKNIAYSMGVICQRGSLGIA